MDQVMTSSKSTLWETPQYIFDRLDAVYNFDVDVCAIKENAKCNKYYTPEIDGLKQKWKGACWMNPPYGRNITGKWVEKASGESKGRCTVVALLPARTDTKWFHTFIYKKPGVTIEFIRGRLKFGNSKNAAPFPSMLVIFLAGNTSPE